MQSFSIIIVTWNAINHLKKFLPSVVKTNHPSFEIILADNASTDESIEWVSKNFPQVRIATLDKNYGYCGGNNRAAKFARYENLIFLNNDVEVTPDWLQPIGNMLNRNSLIGAIQPKIRSWHDKDRFEYAGAAGGFIDRYGFPFCRGRLFDTIEADMGQYNDEIRIFWASGAALVVRKDLFNELDGFEESFEFHMEEIDLCWRLQRMGKEIWYCHESIVYHVGGGSLSADNPQKTYYNFRNNLMMLARNLPSRGLIFRILFRLDLDGLAGINYLIKGQFRNIAAIIRAHFAFYRRIPMIIQYRKNQHAQMRLFLAIEKFGGAWDKSIVWNYFFKGRKKFSDLNIKSGK
jgi:GT2 family glycosyltransferase